MILEIIKYPNPLLRQKSKEVIQITSEISRLVFDMKETMATADGIGLAAPQVGQSLRIIAVSMRGEVKILINPKISKKTKEADVFEEGCLSKPGLFLKITRAKGVEGTALDERGNKISFKEEGISARILQHEIDHLDGVLFFDRIGWWQRFKLRKKLKNAAD